jgi:hypothetical protein
MRRPSTAKERRTKTHDKLPFADGLNQAWLVYQSALIGVKCAHFSGKSSNAKIAVTGQTGTQAPQSIHSTGLMYSWGSDSNLGSSLRGWMQSTGQTSTHAVSFVPTQGSAITYAIGTLLRGYQLLKNNSRLPFAWKVSVYIIKPAGSQAGSFSQKVYHGSINASLFGIVAFAWRGTLPAAWALAKTKPRRLKPALLVFDH